MKELNDGGPAFPPPLVFDQHGKNITWNYRGMSLRDWFAGQAMAGTVGNPDCDPYPHEIAKTAYAIADAMLKAREVKP